MKARLRKLSADFTDRSVQYELVLNLVRLRCGAQTTKEWGHVFFSECEGEIGLAGLGYGEVFQDIVADFQIMGIASERWNRYKLCTLAERVVVRTDKEAPGKSALKVQTLFF